MPTDSIKYKEFLNTDSISTEIRIESRSTSKESPMIINYLVATLFTIGFIIVMTTRPKTN